ncbi:uncharacterized protein [Battus philenor]|uniref:uncharacterized protein n=1 Tax=Battus philenor TaxID=42288 RepID=UPI0035CFAA3F
MKKFGTDPKVKKTLIRNYDQKLSAKQTGQCTYEPKASGSKISQKRTPKKSHYDKNDKPLSQPSICSSEMLANYLTEVTKNVPTEAAIIDQNIDREQISSKITKKLNFHMNEKMYKNLVELNGNVDVQNTRKDRRPCKTTSKRDLEPSIEDFDHDEKDKDLMPAIPIPNYKIKPLKIVENGNLHKLVATFEKL